MYNKKKLERYVLANYATKTVNDLIALLKIDRGTLRTVCKRLEIEPVSPKDKTLHYIREHHATKTLQQIAQELDIKSATLKGYFKELGLQWIEGASARKPGRPVRYTQIEGIDEFLLSNYATKTVSELAATLKLSRYIVLDNCARLGITPTTIKEQSVNYIRTHYTTKTLAEIASALNKTKVYIRYLFNELGLQWIPDTIQPATAVASEELVEVQQLAKARKILANPDLYSEAIIQAAELVVKLFRRQNPLPNRPPAIYTQTHSPFGMADELRGIIIKK